MNCDLPVGEVAHALNKPKQSRIKNDFFIMLQLK